MKPTLRAVSAHNQLIPLDKGNVNQEYSGYPLPPDMQDRPDAAELRHFIRSFQEISDPESRRVVMEAVLLASNCDPRSNG